MARLLLVEGGVKTIPKTTASALSRKLRVGFVPLVDCAPLVMAQELGLFAKQGLKVTLSRELGWATVRDKVIFGELEASHAVAGLPLAATLGLSGLASPCLTGMVLNLHGNGITLSQRLWKAGVRDAETLRAWYAGLENPVRLVFGIVSPFSSHHYLLRDWLTKAGLVAGRDYELAVVPPPQMPYNLAVETLDGYCAGEPWNSIAQQGGTGVCIASSAELQPGHAEKVLMVRESFSVERSEEHVRLLSALLESCALCDDPDQHGQIAQVLSKKQYLGVPSGVILSSLRGQVGTTPGRDRGVWNFHVFSRHDANRPSAAKAWLVARKLASAGVFPATGVSRLESLSQSLFREDIFEAARLHVQAKKAPAVEPLQNSKTPTHRTPHEQPLLA
ncbi:MAG: CmpA/NrtA family ABC transporter substrate-binding protein [Verrucomicrobiae bacterium]|nr:CmpA/NrtA family ABC transporter substrate-binding protein [Verrucomicrobiae bacterium]